MPDTVPVVIVGAGPTGVTAATLLASYGVDVLVLDRWPDVYAQPRAVHLDDEVYRILAQLGVAEEFARISRPSQGLRLQDRHHRVFAEFRRGEVDGLHGYPQANMFDQPELEALLRVNLRKHPAATLRGNVEVTGVHQDDGPVRVDLTDRTTGAHETVHAQYVLGCDGANSVVRGAIGSRMRDLRFEQRWLVVDVNTDHDLGQWEGVHQVCDTDRAATYMRIGDRRYRWEFRLKPGEQSDDFAKLTALRPLIEPWTRGVPDDALEIVRVAEYTFRAQLADTWRDRRAFILGDAAHLTPPFIGQGMGAGLRDAANLAWKLAAVLQGNLPEAALDSYQAERRAHVRAIILLAITVGTAMTAGGKTGDWLRRHLAPRLHLVPGIRGRVLDSATPRLSRSALVDRGRLAGTLCPNLPVDGSRRFDDVAAGRFALVTTRPIDGELPGTAIIETASGQPLHDWLTAGRAAAALVRPDRTVLTAGSSTDVEFLARPRHSGFMSTAKRQLPRAARPFNKVVAKIAGRRFLPVWALVRHRGRKSGKPYETPIAILGSTSKDVYIALPWGRGTDWVRNLQAAGGGALVWKGRAFALTEPTFVDKAEALDAAPGLQRWLARRLLPEDCLRVGLQPST